MPDLTLAVSWSSILIGVALFVASFIINLAIVSIILVKLPADHFSQSHRKKFGEGRHPVLRVLGIIGKNIAGVLLVVLGIRTWMGEPAFAGNGSLSDGWRIPFLLSAILLVVSIWIRLKLNESPVFLRMKEEGRGSKRPLSEAFGQWANLKIAILALLGATAGEAVVWYGGQFYALFFLTQTLKVPAVTAHFVSEALASIEALPIAWFFEEQPLPAKIVLFAILSKHAVRDAPSRQGACGLLDVALRVVANAECEKLH